MGFEYIGPVPDPDKQPPPVPTRPLPDSRTPGDSNPQDAEQTIEPSYREHVSGPLVMHAGAYPGYPQPGQPPYNGQGGYPPFRPPVPSQQPYGYGQRQQFYQQPEPSYGPPYPPNAALPQYGQYPGYDPQGYHHNMQYGMPYAGNYYTPYYYPYDQYPQQPKRDGYILAVAITSLVGSGLVFLGGFVSLFFMIFFVTVLSTTANRTSASANFSAIVLLTALALAGIVGGGFGLYHSIVAVFFKNRPSAQLKLPNFWIFLGLYVVLIVVGFVFRNNAQVSTNEPLTIFFIALAGILPAFSVFALAVRRLHYPHDAPWPTTWRRFTMAILSGATAAILFASIFELILTFLVTLELHINAAVLDNPDMPTPHDPRLILYMLLVASVIAPLVEEGVKPLAVVVLIGRINSAAEAFVLGMSCGIGFDLIETSGYISQGYHDWLDVALERSTAGLLHGFGAGMVALGWYFLTHKKSARRHILLGLGCGVYAVLQHAIWNGSFLLQLLPKPVGPYLESGVIMIGSYPLSAFVLVYVVESALMLSFFLYVTGKLRGMNRTPEPVDAQSQPVGEPQVLNRV